MKGDMNTEAEISQWTRTMESPLIQVNTPGQHFKPKAVALYDRLFTEETLSPGYWVEFFVLRPHPDALAKVFSSQTLDQLLEHRTVTHTLFSAAIANLSVNSKMVNAHSLEIMDIFLRAIAEKRPSSRQLVDILTDHDRMRKQFDELTDGLQKLIFQDILASKLLVTLSTISYGTVFTSVFAQNNFFTTITSRLANISSESEEFKLLLLAIGVLAVLNKFEDRVDFYRLRISEFIDEDLIEKMVLAFSELLTRCSVMMHPPSQPSWFTWFKKSDDNDAEVSPVPPLLSILLPLYEFCICNEIFGLQFIHYSAFPQFINLASRLSQYRRNPRAGSYLRLMHFILRRFVESPTMIQALMEGTSCSENEIYGKVGLVQDKSKHALLADLFDSIQCSIRFSRRPEGPLLELEILYQSLTSLRALRKSFDYNWTQLWQTLFLLMRRLCKEREDHQGTGGSEAVNAAGTLCLCIAGSALSQELFRGGGTDLLYKLFDNGSLLEALSKRYRFEGAPQAALSALKAINAHYNLIRNQADLTSGQIESEVLRQGQHVATSCGYRLLLTTDLVVHFSELSEQRSLQRITRIALADILEDC